MLESITLALAIIALMLCCGVTMFDYMFIQSIDLLTME